MNHLRLQRVILLAALFFVVAVAGALWVRDLARSAVRNELVLGWSAAMLPDASLPMQQSLTETASERYALAGELRDLDPENVGAHSKLFEAALPKVGANGIINVLAENFPDCHLQAHGLGRTLFKGLRDVNAAMRTCQHACTEGCMHGVVMGYFYGDASDADHAEMDDVTARMDAFCTSDAFQNDLRPIECAHGVGHVLLFLADYDLEKALASCELFTEGGQRRYCATGAYMEYLSSGRTAVSSEDDLLFPCRDAKYPSACLAYQVPLLLASAGQDVAAQARVAQLCASADSRIRSGCFFSYGMAFRGAVIRGEMAILDACDADVRADRESCMLGLVQSLVIYYPTEADDVCKSLYYLKAPWERLLCEEAVRAQRSELNRRAPGDAKSTS